MPEAAEVSSPSPAPRAGGLLRALATWFLCLVVLPVLLLACAEGGLRLAGYGYSTAPFIKKEFEGQRYYFRNRHFFDAYQEWRIPSENWEKDELVVPAEKAAGVCRIFVFGESAPQGWPDPYFSFVRMLEAMLHAQYPAQKFEVYNTCMRALNSHTMLREALACADMQPDFFVVYLGNNEVHGPFGLMSLTGSTARFPSRLEIKAQLLLAESRLMQFLQDSLGARTWSAMRKEAPTPVSPDDPRLPEVYARYEENLRAICAAASGAGAASLLCTVPVNLRDWRPSDSFLAPGISKEQTAAFDDAFNKGRDLVVQERYEEAVPPLERALAIDASHAEAHYRMGQAKWAQGDFTAAREEFTTAHLRDGFTRVRAKPPINETVRRLAAELSPDARLVEVQEAIIAAAEQQCPGLDMFDDYCHFTPRGSYLFARTVLEQLRPALEQKFTATAARAVPEYAECMKLVGLHPFMRAAFIENMLAQERFWDGEPQRRMAEQGRALRESGGADPQQTLRIFLSECAQWPNSDRFVLIELMRNQLLAGANAECIATGKRLLQARPYDRAGMNITAQALFNAGDTAGAEALFAQCVAIYPDDARSIDGLYRMAIARNDNASAEQWARMAIDAEDIPSRKQYRKGRLAQLQGRDGKALALFRSAAEADKNFPESYEGLDEVLRKGDAQERVITWKEVAAAHPDWALPAKFLARALDGAGQKQEAIAAFERALQLEPGDLTLSLRLAELRQ